MRSTTKLLLTLTVCIVCLILLYALSEETQAKTETLSPSVTPTPFPFFTATVDVLPDTTLVKISETVKVRVSVIPMEGCFYPLLEMTLRQSELLFAYTDPPTMTVRPITIRPNPPEPFTYTLAATRTGTTTFTASVFGEYQCDGMSWTWSTQQGQSSPVIVSAEKFSIFFPQFMK